jgi:hypothetical protein
VWGGRHFLQQNAFLFSCSHASVAISTEACRLTVISSAVTQKENCHGFSSTHIHCSLPFLHLLPLVSRLFQSPYWKIYFLEYFCFNYMGFQISQNSKQSLCFITSKPFSIFKAYDTILTSFILCKFILNLIFLL